MVVGSVVVADPYLLSVCLSFPATRTQELAERAVWDSRWTAGIKRPLALVGTSPTDQQDTTEHQLLAIQNLCVLLQLLSDP